MEERIVEMVFCDWHIVRAWLTKLGIKIEEIDGQQNLSNPNCNATLKIGLCWEQSDYTTRAVQLGFLFFSYYWTSLCPNLLDKVSKQWSTKNKKGKKENAALPKL